MTTARRVVELALAVARDGGDPHPETCPAGAGSYCLRCCLAAAKGMADDEATADAAFFADPFGDRVLPTDWPLLEARQAVLAICRGDEPTDRDGLVKVYEAALREMG
jgi:hypothetical protein